MFRLSSLAYLETRVPKGAVLVIARKDIALWTSLAALLPHFLNQTDRDHAT